MIKRRKRIELWAKSIKIFGKFGSHFSRKTFAKFLAAYARVCRKVMAQFVLKIEKTVPYHKDSPSTRNGARIRSPFPIMAPCSGHL